MKNLAYFFSFISHIVLIYLDAAIANYLKPVDVLSHYIGKITGCSEWAFDTFYFGNGFTIIYYFSWVVLAFLYSFIMIKICSKEAINSRIKSIVLLSMWPAIFAAPIRELNIMVLPTILTQGIVMFITLRFFCK